MFREALFSIWQERLDGSRFLDLFAGSGAVGLEALSRGAREVVLVEKSARVRRVLLQNCRALSDTGWRILAADLPRELPTLVPLGPFALVFADPPYRFSAYARLVSGTEVLLDTGGLLAIEHSRRVALPGTAGNLMLVDSRRYGESRLTLYESSGASGVP